jgi:hypothetical protein
MFYVSTLFSVTPTTFSDHEATSIFAAIDFPLSAITQQNDPFLYTIFAEIDKTFGKSGIALDSYSIDTIKKTYLYLVFLAKLEKVKKDPQVKQHFPDFLEFIQDNNQQLPHLPTEQLITSASWNAVKITNQDLVNSQTWQLFCKAMITDTNIYFSIALQTIHNVEKQTFNYIPHFETSFYNADYTSLRTINEITRARIDLEETLKQRYLAQCPDWNAIANPPRTTAAKNPKSQKPQDPQAIFGKTVVTFMHTLFYQATHNMTVLAGANNNPTPQFKSPIKEQVWCYFMLHEVHGLLTKHMTDQNLSQMLDVMSNSQLIPNIFPYTLDDFVLLDELLAAKSKTEGNNTDSIHPSPSNFHVEENISTKQVQNDPRLLRHVKEQVAIHSKKEVQVQSIWSDIGHAFTSAFDDVKDEVEKATKATEHIATQAALGAWGLIKTTGEDIAHEGELAGQDMKNAGILAGDAVWHVTQAAGQTIAGAGASLAGALGTGIEAVGSLTHIKGLASAGDSLHSDTATWGKNELAAAQAHFNLAATDLISSVDDFKDSLENGIVAPFAEITGELTGVILDDQAIGTDISTVINQVTDTLINVAAEAGEVVVQTEATVGALAIRTVRVTAEFAQTVADAAWAISSKQGQQAFLQDGEDLGKTCLTAITQTFTGLLDMTKGALEAVLTGLTTITNSLTTLFIDLAREITYLVLSGRILALAFGGPLSQVAALAVSEYIPVGNKFADQARDDVSNTLNAHRQTINQVMGVAISLVPAVAAIVMSGGTAAPAVIAAETAMVTAEAGASAAVTVGAEAAATAATTAATTTATTTATIAAGSVEAGTTTVAETATQEIGETAAQETQGLTEVGGKSIFSEEVGTQVAETSAKDATQAAEEETTQIAKQEAEAVAKAVGKQATRQATREAAAKALENATTELNDASKAAQQAADRVREAQAALDEAMATGDQVAQTATKEALDSATKEAEQATEKYSEKLAAKLAAKQAVAVAKISAKQAAKSALNVATKEAEQASKEAGQAIINSGLKQQAKMDAQSALDDIMAKEGSTEAEQTAAKETLDKATQEAEQAAKEAEQATAKSVEKTAAKLAAKQAFDATPKYATALEALQGEAIGLVMNAGFGLFNIVGGFNQDQNALLKENNQSNALKNLWKFINENKIATAQSQLTYLDEIQEKQQAEIGNQTLALALYQNLIYAGVDTTKNQIASALAPQYIQNLTPDSTTNLLPADIGSSWGLVTNYLDLYLSQGFFTSTTGRFNFPYAQEIAQAPLAATQATSTAKSATPILDKLWFNQRATALDLQDEKGVAKQPLDPLTVQMDVQFIYTLDSAFHVGLYLGGNYQNYSSRNFLARLLNTTVANVTQQLASFQSYYVSSNFNADGSFVKTPPANLINSSVIDLDQAHLSKMFVLYRDLATDALSIGVYEHEGLGWILQQSLPASLQLDKQHTYQLTAVLSGASLTITLCADNNPVEIVQETISVTPIANQRTYGVICSGAAIEWNQISPNPQLIVNGAARPATKDQPEITREKQAKIDLAKELNPKFGLFNLTSLSKRRILLGQYVYHTTDTDFKKIDPTAADFVVFATMQNDAIVDKSLGKHPSNAITPGQTTVLVSLITGTVYDSTGKNIASATDVWKNYEASTHGPLPTSLGDYITKQQAVIATSLSNINFGKFVLDIISPESLSSGQYIYTCTQTINAKDSTGKPMIDYLVMAEVTNNALGNLVGMSPISSNAQGLISLVTGNLYLKNTVLAKGITPKPIASYLASAMLSPYGNSADYTTIINAETAYDNYLTAQQQQKSTTTSKFKIIPVTSTTSSSIAGIHPPLHGVKIGLSNKAPGVHLHFPGEKSISDRQQSAAGNAGFELIPKRSGGVHLKL